jgi:DNA end-binding protein Ku
LREALVQTDRMAVVLLALRQRESIAVPRVRDKVIVPQTMPARRDPRARFRDPRRRRRLRPRRDDGRVAGREPGADFDPSQFHDE